jgi:hypothetical protein
MFDRDSLYGSDVMQVPNPARADGWRLTANHVLTSSVYSE